MEFAYYKEKNSDSFENQLKELALNKHYKYSKEVEVLKEEEILEKSSSHERELLKIFKDKAQMTTYHFKNHKSNYLIIVGETKDPGVIGLAVIFDKKPFKQTGKLAMATLLGLSILSGGGIIAAVASLGVLGSYAKRSFAIKGPLGKEIAQIIESNFGKPIEIKE